jgi:hypothetical protein
MGRFELGLAVVLHAARWLALTVPAMGQIIVPVDRQQQQPRRVGVQRCRLKGLLKVGAANGAVERYGHCLGQSWTEV